MRIYLPTTTSGLRELVDHGAIAGSAGEPLTAFAVTPELRDWYVNDADADAEELEYAALTEAARGSLRLLDAEPGAHRRRVVLAVDVADTAVEIRDDLERGVVRLADSVPMAAVASAHVDDAEAEATVAAAAAAVIAADLGDDGSRERVDDAEGFELSWYANQEDRDAARRALTCHGHATWIGTASASANTGPQRGSPTTTPRPGGETPTGLRTRTPSSSPSSGPGRSRTPNRSRRTSATRPR